MSLCSMTGFGAARYSDETRQVRIEVHAVNHRYLKVQWRLPETLARFEALWEPRVRGTLARGAVTVRVRFRSRRQTPELAVDTARARAYERALASLTGERPALPAAALVQLPGVLVEAGDGADLDPEDQAALEAALDEALAACAQARRAEGRSTQAALARELAALQEPLAAIRARAPALAPALRDRLLERVRRLLAGTDVALAPADLTREVALLADRADVTEELDRLDHHLRVFREALTAGGEQGRRLDFLAQELLREANTIGSKAADAQVTDCVVALKTGIERLKEQVQNVE